MSSTGTGLDNLTKDPATDDEPNWQVVSKPTPPPANAAPTITSVRPLPGSRITDRTPLISATVRDRQTNLRASNIRLFVDGSSKSFSYNRATDRRSYASTRLLLGPHTVRISATDGQGKRTVRAWAFRVRR